MKKLTKGQTYLAAFLLIVGAVAIEELLSLVLAAGIAKSLTLFVFVMLLMWVLDKSPMPGWRRLNVPNKLIFAGLLSLAPHVLGLIRG